MTSRATQGEKRRREIGDNEITPPHPGKATRTEVRGEGPHHPNLLNLLLKAGQCTQVLLLLEFFLPLEDDGAPLLRNCRATTEPMSLLAENRAPREASVAESRSMQAWGQKADPKARPAWQRLKEKTRKTLSATGNKVQTQRRG